MKKLYFILKNEKGAYTIETSIIMTIALTIILLLITMSHIMYEQTRINAIAQNTAERAGVVYSVAGKDMVMGRVDPTKFKETSPYWRLLGVNENRITAVQDYALAKLNKYKINQNKYTRDNVTITYKDYFVYKRVCVEITNTYKVPFGGLLSLFIDKNYAMKAYAEAAINEQAEMIRNVDMVADIVDRLTAGTAVGRFLDKYKDKINDIKAKISG